MTKKRFTESEIVRVLKEHAAGTSISDLITKYGVSQATIYNWKAKYGGLSISEVYRIHELEEENDRLKRMFADLSLENMILKSKLERLK